MHNWFEGVLQHHFLTLWGFNLHLQKHYAKPEDIECSDLLQEDIIMYNNEEQDNNLEENDTNSGYLSEDIKNIICKHIGDVVVTKGVTRVSSLVGKSQNGKFKASEWKSLFSVYLPMIFFEAILRANSNYNSMRLDNHNLILNLCALVQCTNIVSSKVIKKEDSSKFSQHYNTYQKTLLNLFTECQIVPNHHYQSTFHSS
ncbi:hypothetical protein O181_075314 [Austropuccinia psidii MF-1]|uniref:Uncharacterized protein n=1 Tax=Austropuccinia psidii MF-1 TaxID=1389203 RepID=A0A9Q3IEC8_9BASI|nr:hypothetical protein [Austropuccinia psidii MF-1]